MKINYGVFRSSGFFGHFCAVGCHFPRASRQTLINVILPRVLARELRALPPRAKPPTIFGILHPR